MAGTAAITVAAEAGADVGTDGVRMVLLMVGSAETEVQDWTFTGQSPDLASTLSLWAPVRTLLDGLSRLWCPLDLDEGREGCNI